MRFEHEFSVNAPIDRVWDFLMNIPAMASCIPGTSDVNRIDDTHYDATVAAKIGPITAKFGCRITIVALDPGAHSASVEMAGKDAKLGGGINGKMTMTLAAIDAGNTRVRIVSDVDILGKIGQYGHGMISKRADAMLTDFAAAARAKLA